MKYLQPVYIDANSFIEPMHALDWVGAVFLKFQTELLDTQESQLGGILT